MKIAVIFDWTGPMAVREEHLELLRQTDPEAEIRFAMKPEELIEAGFKAELLVCWGTGGRFTCGSYCAFDDELRWIHCLSSGTEGLMEDPVVGRPGLLVSCSKGIHGIPMANHVMGFILYFLRHFKDAEKNKRERLWSKPAPEEATGKQLCIIGLGNIGRCVAKAAKAFGMHTVGIKRSIAPVEDVDEVLPTEELDRVLAESDFTVMLLPIYPGTKGFMSAERFAAMKPGSVFINVGRGQTVDEEAMIAALKSGHLGGAALDAFAQEPLPDDSPLWEMDNVLITAHYAADSPLYMTRAFQLLAEDLACYQKGEPLVSGVSLTDRY